MPFFSIPQSALGSLDVVMQATANNIANVNTNGYKAQRVVLQSGPADEGVRVGAIFRDMTPGPAIINAMAENDVRDSIEVSARAVRTTQENFDSAVAQDVQRSQQADTAEAWRIEDYRKGELVSGQLRGIAEGSNTDLPREFANLLVTETAYSANAATIRAWDEMTGSLLNVKV